MEHFCRLVGHNGMKYFLIFIHLRFHKILIKIGHAKVGFSLWLQSPRNVPNHYPEPYLPTLDSGLDVGQKINVGPGKFGNKNKCRALNNFRASKL